LCLYKWPKLRWNLTNLHDSSIMLLGSFQHMNTQIKILFYWAQRFAAFSKICPSTILRLLRTNFQMNSKSWCLIYYQQRYFGSVNPLKNLEVKYSPSYSPCSRKSSNYQRRCPKNEGSFLVLGQMSTNKKSTGILSTGILSTRRNLFCIKTQPGEIYFVPKLNRAKFILYQNSTRTQPNENFFGVKVNRGILSTNEFYFGVIVNRWKFFWSNYQPAKFILE